jgi:mercuric ion binding protein
MFTRLSRFLVLSGLACLWTTQALGEVKVTVSKTHLCCQGCVDVVDTKLSEVKGIKHEASQDQRTITITAEKKEDAQKAIDALAAAGFYGKLDNPDVKYRAVEASKEKVARLEVMGVHNCCGACARAIKTALKGVEGVTGDTAKAKADTFVIEGDFVAASAVEALLNAGFYVRLKK